MNHTEINIELFKEYRRGLPALQDFAFILDEIKNNQNDRFIIDLTEYCYIHPCFAVLLAAMPYVNKKTVIRYKNNNNKCVEFLEKSGIYEHFTSKSAVQEIGYKTNLTKFKTISTQEECLKVAQDTVSAFPIYFDNNLRHELVSLLYEVISNPFFHSQQKQVYCCGFFDTQRALNFSIYDFGVGIPYNVNSYLNKNLSDQKAIEWAWKPGHSTLNGKVDYPRGAGFQTLESFVKANHGDILLGSRNAYCRVTTSNKTFGTMNATLPGTFFSMRIKKDFQHKYIENENNDIIKKDV